MRVSRRARERGPAPGTAATVWIAVVCSGGRELFTAAAVSEDELVARLTGYLRERAGLTLWPSDARRVGELLECGHARLAVETYFARVGDRWDREHLHVHAVDLGGSAVEPALVPGT